MLIISFSCLPNREDNLYKLFDSIKNQILQPNYVVINCPKKCIRLGISYNIEKIKNIIDDIKTTGNYLFKIIFNVTEFDYGPITKIYPLLKLKNNFDKNDMVIIIDDDRHYNKYLFDYLVQIYNSFEGNKCVCISGLLYPTHLNSYYNCTLPGNETELMEGSFGYIFKYGFLEDDFDLWIIEAENYEDVKNAKFENSFLSDDYIVSRYLDSKNINKIVAYYQPLINKNNIDSPNIEMDKTYSLCGLGSNLDKYFYSNIELKERKL
jgi:hypothetical protein